MADLKITDLTAAGALSDTDLIEVSQGIGGTPVTRKLSWSSIKATLKTYFDGIYQAAGSYLTASSTATLTNKTFNANGTGNSLSNVETADIAAGSKSGSDTKLITGTAGTSGDLSVWNADGDLVDGPTPPSGAIVGTSDTQTLTNKRIAKRVTTTTDDATAVIDTDTCDIYQLSAVANDTEFTLTGTPTDGQKLEIRVKDAGVTKTLTFTGFTAIGCTIPAATTAGKWHYIGCEYNLAATAWHVVAVAIEA